jgi:AcrR family transcriptional regulator
MKGSSVPVASAPHTTAARGPRRGQARKKSRGNAVTSEPTRERILSAAAQLFAEQGFTRASMPAIASLSGITAGAIYRHFESKAELLLEVVKRALRVLPLSLEGGNGENDAAVLPEVAARLTDPALKLLRQLSLEVHAAACRDPEVRKLLVEYDETAMRRIRALIETAQQARKRRVTHEAEFTARVLTVFLMGLNHMDTLHPHLVGDRAWREFVASHVAALVGT